MLKKMMVVLALALSLTHGVQAAPTIMEVEREILRLTNQERARAGLPPLLPQPALTLAARGHSDEMVQLNYFDHTSPLAAHAKCWNRVDLTGFQTSQVAENLYEAEGYSASEIPQRVIQAWMSSPAHRRNILDGHIVFGGIGISQHGPKMLITQVLSGPRDQP